MLLSRKIWGAAVVTFSIGKLLDNQLDRILPRANGAVIPVSLQADFLKMNGRDRVFLKMIITLNNDEIISSFWLAVMWGCSQCYSFDNNLLLYLMNSLKLRNSWIQTKNGSKSFFSPSYTRLRSQLLLTLHPLLKLGTQTNDECTEKNFPTVT